MRAIGDLEEEEMVTVEAAVGSLRRIRTRRRGLTLVQGRARDDSGELRVVWFNRPFLTKQLDEGVRLRLHGRFKPGPSADQGSRGELVNPSFEPAGQTPASLVPVYPRIGDLGPVAVGRLLGTVLECVPLEELEEPLPTWLLGRHGLPSLGRALAWLHRPPEGATLAELEDPSSPARSRLSYGELLRLQLRVQQRLHVRQSQRKPHRYRLDDRTREAARAVLPFRLTEAQKRVLREVISDLKRPEPMHRLLQGDVGCGKTIVAALSMVVAVESGLQTAFMAPTELLAEQHYASLQQVLGGRYPVGLLTRSTADVGRLRQEIAAGSVPVVVGTHALLQEETRFARLGLAVIDEQHRFGVDQRRTLTEKGAMCDTLVMTATPIPRSLALTVYGDLAVSVIDELPPGRRPVSTEIVPEEQRQHVYDLLCEELASGAQAYVVVPLIDQSDSVSAASLEREGARIRELLRDYEVAVLHGRVPRDERAKTMDRFARGEVRVLLATTVIEVGVDVPEATVMVIESAERFGLSQLHQLRGRVGRGTRSSRCIAVHGSLTAEGEERLRIFEDSCDGFRIAEEDLALRGPGDVVGTRQAGMNALRVAHPLRDAAWLERARDDARQLLAEVPPDAPLWKQLGMDEGPG